MKYILYTLFSILIASQTFAQYDSDALEILNAMSAKYKQINAFSADFSQNMSNKDVGIDETFEGSITVKGAKYTLKVAGQQIYNDGTDVWSYNPEIAEVTVAPYDPDEQEISMSNIYDLYKEGFKYNLESVASNGDRTIVLDPEDRNKSFFKIKLSISSTDALKSFTVMEKSGNVYLYSIMNFAEKSDMSDAAFTFDANKYPDVEVIDFR